jgi:hypothetical protein
LPNASLNCIRAVGAAAPKREAPVIGCWVTDHWSDTLTVKGHEDWPGRSQPGPDADELGLVAVLVARDTGSTAVAWSIRGAWVSRTRRDGKPTFINGPHDDAFAILAKLRKSVGEGNYDCLIGSGPRSIG